MLKINYIEFPTRDIGATKGFFAEAFGWEFDDYGPGYQTMNNAGLDGGIDANGDAEAGALVVLKADDLEAALERVKAAGAEITAEIFDFPGGRRFEFREPGGNRMAVWAEK